MSETMPINYTEQAQTNLAKNLELLEQYNNVTSQVKSANLELFQSTQISNKQLTLVKEKPLTKNILELKSQLQKIGDAMVFGPIDWIMYKNQTKENMNTLGDFVAHCEKGDVICPLRFAFLKARWNLKHDFDALDLKMELKEFINTDIFEEIVGNQDFMNDWWENELRKDEKGNVTKWGVGYKY